MKIRFWLYALTAVGLLFLAASCTALPLKADNNPPAKSYSTIKLPPAQSTTTAQKVATFLKNKRPQILALLALLFLMSIARLWEQEKRHLQKKFKEDDLALLKIIKDNAARIWKQQTSKGKIIRLDDRN